MVIYGYKFFEITIKCHCSSIVPCKKDFPSENKTPSESEDCNIISPISLNVSVSITHNLGEWRRRRYKDSLQICSEEPSLKCEINFWKFIYLVRSQIPVDQILNVNARNYKFEFPPEQDFVSIYRLLVEKSIFTSIF